MFGAEMSATGSILTCTMYQSPIAGGQNPYMP